MKKILLGVLIGIVLAFPLSAAAAEVASLIGKRIEGVRPIEIGGNRASVDAIVVGGTSYAPVRAVAEMLGMNVRFENGVIVLFSKSAEERAALAAVEEAEIQEQTRLENEAKRNERGETEQQQRNREFAESIEASLDEARQNTEEVEAQLEEARRNLAEVNRLAEENRQRLAEQQKADEEFRKLQESWNEETAPE